MHERPPPSEWAYFYQILGSLDEPALAAINDLLIEENSRAHRQRSAWSARLVIEDGLVRILVVCDSPAQDRKVNRRLEAHLKRLGIAFSVTVPMAIGDDNTPITRTRRKQD